MVFSLADQLSFYASYHQERRNQRVHLLFVPIIFCSALTALATVKTELATPAAEFQPIKNIFLFTENNFPHYFIPFIQWIRINFLFNFSFFLWILFSFLYFLLSPFISLPLNFILFFLYLIGNDIAYNYSSISFSFIILSQLIGWISQIFSHFYFERRRPAVFDSIFQSIFLAPMFVWVETLFELGFLPELREETQRRVQERLRAEKKSGKNN